MTWVSQGRLVHYQISAYWFFFNYATFDTIIHDNKSKGLLVLTCLVAKPPSKGVSNYYIRSMLRWKFTCTISLSPWSTHLGKFQSVFLHTESFHYQLHNWCNCNPSRIILEYLLVLSIFSYQLRHQCNCMSEWHINSKKVTVGGDCDQEAGGMAGSRGCKWSIWRCIP